MERFVYFRSLSRELRGIREVLEVLADQQRANAGLGPLYGENSVREPDPVAPADPLFGQGEYLSVYCVEELAREHNIRLTGSEDLEQLALERGWIDKEGRFLVLPESMQGK